MAELRNNTFEKKHKDLLRIPVENCLKNLEGLRNIGTKFPTYEVGVLELKPEVDVM